MAGEGGREAMDRREVRHARHEDTPSVTRGTRTRPALHDRPAAWLLVIVTVHVTVHALSQRTHGARPAMTRVRFAG